MGVVTPGKKKFVGFLVINVCNHGEYFETPCILMLPPYIKLMHEPFSCWHFEVKADMKRHIFIT